MLLHQHVCLTVHFDCWVVGTFFFYLNMDMGGWYIDTLFINMTTFGSTAHLEQHPRYEPHWSCYQVVVTASQAPSGARPTHERPAACAWARPSRYSASAAASAHGATGEQTVCASRLLLAH
jgi:hypothetical protein